MATSLSSVRRRATVYTCSALVAASALAGCSSSGDDGGTSADGTTNLSVTVSGTFLTSAPLYVAQEKGYFAKEGLNVKVTTTNGATTAISALFGNSAQVSLTGLNQGINSTVKGQAVTAFAATNNQLPIQVVVSNKVWDDNNLADADQQTRIAALKGLNLGVVTPTGQNALIFDSLFKSIGTDRQGSGATYTVLGDPNGIYTAFAQGRIDGFDLNPFYPQQAEAEGKGHIIIDIAAGEVDPLKDMVNAGFVATPDYIKSHGDVLQKFTNAIAAAEIWEATNPDDAATLLHDKYFPRTPVDQLEAAFKTLIEQGGLSPDPTIDDAGFKKFVDFLFAAPGAAKLNVSVDSLYTNQFASSSVDAGKKLVS